jgi:hypothetical protein
MLKNVVKTLEYPPKVLRTSIMHNTNEIMKQRDLSQRCATEVNYRSRKIVLTDFLDWGTSFLQILIGDAVEKRPVILWPCLSGGTDNG